MPRNRDTTSSPYPWERRHASWFVLGVALLLRFGIGLHSYSGKLVCFCMCTVGLLDHKTVSLGVASLHLVLYLS